MRPAKKAQPEARDRQSEFVPSTVHFLLLPRCNLIGINNAIEVLRIANRLNGTELYRWKLITRDASPITASNGITLIPDYGIKAAPRADLVLVCASYDAHLLADSTICQYLRRLSRHGIPLGGIGQGSYVLARAGLLEGYRCTIHWEQRPGLVEDFPGLEVTSNLYEIDRNRLTCGGGTAALDMMMQHVAAAHGARLAAGIASQLLHDRLRPPGHPQPYADVMQASRISPKLVAAINLMEENIEAPLPITDICSRTQLGQRHLERLFHQCFGINPQKYYLNLRLRHARELLLETNLSPRDVALATGFGTRRYFRRCYQRTFGVAPTYDRKRSHGLTSVENKQVLQRPNPGTPQHVGVRRRPRRRARGRATPSV